MPVEIENNWHNFYVLKRPGVDKFLQKMGELYEVVVFTASLAKVRSPLQLPNAERTHLLRSVCGPSIRQARPHEIRSPQAISRKLL